MNGSILMSFTRWFGRKISPRVVRKSRQGPKIFFTANDLGPGRELWVTDGTPGNASLLKDVNPGSDDSLIADPVVVGNTMYFRATDGTHGEELWKTDGTASGTQMVLDIN